MLGNFLANVAAPQGFSPRFNENLYRSTVGALQHVYVTRPDIHFVVNKFI